MNKLDGDVRGLRVYINSKILNHILHMYNSYGLLNEDLLNEFTEIKWLKPKIFFQILIALYKKDRWDLVLL